MPIPAFAVDIKQHRAGRIRIVGGVDLAAGEFPDQISIDGAEKQFPFFGALFRSLDILQNPMQFGGGKIGIDHQSCCLADIRPFPLFQFLAEFGGAAALPDNGIADRLARLLIPDQRCFPLVGDADGGKLGRLNIPFQQRFR